MDRFLKRPCSSNLSSHSPAAKKPMVSSKQGSVSAAIRVAEFGRDKFYVDAGRLFCKYCNVVVDHVKNTVDRHLKSKVLSLIVQKYWVFYRWHSATSHSIYFTHTKWLFAMINIRLNWVRIITGQSLTFKFYWPQ